ncbi:transposon ty3-i Gag-Pol polyprotein [Plakobranchus ocellatus]|uniref:Transposon ty3-i Gag-Pol polyprotein n=1 Tax=Plakobranchus ocellatus TaxID=259542 RepID=A0AAV4CF45_9GAST|nr:transposon ty3-i Gag-Pol polyprotein [Plakobranchus ocellatus]
MDQTLEECRGTLGISDDVCVFGATEEEHDRNLCNLMEVSKKRGLVFNKDNCHIKKDKINFYGLIWDSKGAHPDPKKCANIIKKLLPTNVTELQQFLSLVQYMSPFIPSLSENTQPLRSLLHKNVEWQWINSHEKAFNKLKNLIHKDLTLGCFQPNMPSVIEVDSSLNGLGAVLLQNDAPVAFASKSLTETEKRYANIERELLAVVFGCERFHTYIYGKPVIVKSDHKLLQNIHQKHIAHVAPRLQRMLLRIQPYDCTILYKPGKEMVIADYLSRANPEEGNTIALEATIYAVHAKDSKIEQIKTERKKDPELGPLLEQIIHGWPDNSNQVQKGLRRYWSIKDYLSVDDGLVLKGIAIVIPKTMRAEILARIHDGHQGIQKSILKARDCVYWHSLQKDITEMVQSCIHCSEHSKSQRKEPLQPHKILGRPWQKIAADGQQFLMVADYYSKMPFVKSMAKITSNACIEYVKSIFAFHGIPDELITDNGRQFVSEEFQLFTKS